jgi:alpha-mannosidase
MLPDLTASNPNATYNWEIGTIQRPNAQERQFEVASHRWIDMTDRSGSFGTTLLTDDKNGSDKPNDNTLRLTLLRTPGINPPTNGQPANYTDQANQDWGHHEFSFGLAGHAGSWQQAQTDWQAYRLNDPLMAFQTSRHPGSLGGQFSLVRLSNPRICVLALKQAEATDEVILRLVAYAYSYLFAYTIDVTGDPKSITLPVNDKIRILAVSTANVSPSLVPVQPLYDTLGRTEPTPDFEGNSR